MVAYTAAAINFTFSFHYCGGAFHGICFTSDTEADCCGVDVMDDDCCSDKIVSAKFKDDHTPAAKAALSMYGWDWIVPYYTVPVHFVNTYVSHRVLHTGHSPPILGTVPIYLFVRVLRL
ncbi:MAG: hypothetical protein K0Q79_2188 [Flavipsychrobacter sp.]|nr:hypothetical protein [Flavipsychrobacter sp.]